MTYRGFSLPASGLAIFLLMASLLSAQAPDAGSERATDRPISLGESLPAWHEKLQDSVALDYYDTPLYEIAEHISKTNGVPVQIDHRALENVALSGDDPITYQVEGISLKAALNLMLRDLDLTWTVQDDVLFITTPDEIGRDLITRVYPVRDLVVEGSAGGQFFPANGLNGNDFFRPFHRASSNYSNPDFDSLIDVIAHSIEPDSWDQVGGPGSIEGYEPAEALVISQALQVHEQIENLLRNLRAARDLIPSASPTGSEGSQAADPDALLLRIYHLRPPVDPGVYLELMDEAPARTQPAAAPGAWEEQVGEAIIAMVQPESWNEQGGAGELRTVPGAILVRQTARVQREVQQVLASLSSSS